MAVPYLIASLHGTAPLGPSIRVVDSLPFGSLEQSNLIYFYSYYWEPPDVDLPGADYFVHQPHSALFQSVLTARLESIGASLNSIGPYRMKHVGGRFKRALAW